MQQFKKIPFLESTSEGASDSKRQRKASASDSIGMGEKAPESIQELNVESLHHLDDHFLLIGSQSNSFNQTQFLYNCSKGQINNIFKLHDKTYFLSSTKLSSQPYLISMGKDSEENEAPILGINATFTEGNRGHLSGIGG